MTTLGLFFTRGVSLRKWVNSGLFDREVLIYHKHLESGFFSKIYWFTYGTDDVALERELHESGQLRHEIMVIQCPRWFRYAGRGYETLYSIIMPLIILRKAFQCDVYKTNQMDGSIAALICAKLLKRPVYVRTGYTLSRAVKKMSPNNLFRQFTACMNEKLAFSLASASSVSSCYDKKYLIKKYGEQIGYRLEVVVNYVDTNLFTTGENLASRSGKILYVGRLSPEKNLRNAISACAIAGCDLDVVGTGEELASLKVVARECGVTVNWLGVIANKELPKLLGRYRYFILPSLWEGLPKALLEALSAGLVCIGNDTTGINEIIKDGVTGFLSDAPDPESIAIAIKRAKASDWILISCAGREYVCNEFSLEMVANKEREIILRIINNKMIKRSEH